jgi:LmbE family N-acetylglucosaminyl deacetylase
VSISRRAVLASVAGPILRSGGVANVTVIVVSGHPGDAECGCGGTIAHLADLGHNVTVVYLNRGEGYCGGAKLYECASIRTREAQSASDI